MPKVKSLAIRQQGGTDNTFYATWDFDGAATNHSTTWAADQASNGVRVGDLVSITGSTWYNGYAIPDWVKAERWYVTEVHGDRAVVNQNEAGTNRIESPINVAYLSGGSGGSGSQSGSAAAGEDTLDHYDVRWWYDTGDGIWFDGGSTTSVSHDSTWGNHWESSTYSPPDNAVRIQVQVRPISKTYKSNDRDVSYWNGTISSAEYDLTGTKKPAVPPSPACELSGFRLVATVDNVADAWTERIRFEVYKVDRLATSGTVTVRAARAQFSCSVDAGGPYRVRCRALRWTGGAMSDWTEYVDAGSTVPPAPSGITSIRATSPKSVALSWGKAAGATSYEVEYAPDYQRYLGQSDKAQSISGIETSSYELTDLDEGKRWYFRVRAANDKGSSSWTAAKGIAIGEAPAAPRERSSAPSAVVGEKVTLYWVHQSRDNSAETQAQIWYSIDGVQKTLTVTDDEPGSADPEQTHAYELDTSSLKEGAEVRWCVRTKGAYNEYGPWGETMTIRVWARPTLALSLTDPDGAAIAAVSSFPFIVKAVAGPETQQPLGYHLSIISRAAYESVDERGERLSVVAGQEVYDEDFDTSDVLRARMTPASIDLEGGQSYVARVRAAMSSGIVAQSELEFAVSWADASYEPNAEIGIDEDAMTAQIRPYCLSSDGSVATGVRLAVYRRESDGSLQEVASGLDPERNVFVVDPHPPLYEPSYRIVATDEATGAISWYDTSSYPWHYRQAVIQWDEEWSEFSGASARMAGGPWSGSLLRLRWDLDVDETADRDAVLVEYAGREHPVSYHGTQVGQSVTFKADVLRDDRETLYQLRRLQRWMGDAYVRDTSGIGFWASLDVEISREHGKVTVPVTITATRVEGGA